MEDKLEKIFLYETYKELLTENMQDIFEQYYFSDLSLREIGENNAISYQAVRDTLKKVEKGLAQYEAKLRLGSIKKKIENLSEYLESSELNLDVLKDKIKELGDC